MTLSLATDRPGNLQRAFTKDLERLLQPLPIPPEGKSQEEQCQGREVTQAIAQASHRRQEDTSPKEKVFGLDKQQEEGCQEY